MAAAPGGRGGELEVDLAEARTAADRDSAISPAVLQSDPE
jgi:hypothetical protein